jgi:ADP-glucose pyrophosphorylase
MKQKEKQVLKYYRFKIYWKKVAIKKYLEEHMGIKSSKLREIKKLRLQNGEQMNQ